MRQRPTAIVLGGSAGALDVLQIILPGLPRTLPVPVAIVLHMLPGRPSGLADVLGRSCVLPVREADDKQSLEPGTVYVAPPNYHLLVERQRYFSLSVDEPVLFSRPSIDVLFESFADAYGPALVGVLLSGANEDGAAGLARIQAAGGTAVVQSPDSAVARSMPEAAIRLGAADYVLPSREIASLLVRLVSGEPTESTPAGKERG
jgi:two-component system, chemotaxis family, protein-glutamate methylesterase/glutaminase